MKNGTNQTAMQDLIDKLNYSIQNSKGQYQLHFLWIKSHCLLLLEKEKEQIVNAFDNGMEEQFNHIDDMYGNGISYFINKYNK